MVKRTPEDAARLDPVVEQAMKQLTSWTYHRKRSRQAPAVVRRVVAPLILGRSGIQPPWRPPQPKREKGLKDPSSRAGAIHTFKHLKHHGYSFDPAAVRAWAISHGWTDHDAEQLGAYAEGVLTGQRYHTAPDPFGFHAIERWRAEAEGR